jgi:hypothetical protein
MDENDIAIFLFLYDDNERVWRTGDRIGQEERNFIRTLVNQFEHHRNLIWCTAEEYQEALSVERVKKIAGEIKAADDYDHAVAVHKLNGLDFSEFADEPNIDQFAIQYNVKAADELHAGLVKAWKQAKGRYNLNMSEAADWGTGTELRNKCWACAMAGAYVMILGMDIATTAKSDLEDCGRLVRFFESTDFQQMSPHDELAFAGTQYVLARPGRSYIAYASQLQGKIGLKNMPSGVYKFRWFDCAKLQKKTEPCRKASKAGISLVISAANWRSISNVSGDRNEKQGYSMDVIWCWFGTYLLDGLFYWSGRTERTVPRSEYGSEARRYILCRAEPG